MKRVKLKIDAQHTRDLLCGKPAAIKVPSGADVIEFRLADFAKEDFVEQLLKHMERERPIPMPLAKILDVFFNGRPA